MEPAIYGDFELVTAEYLMEGETKNFQCVWPYYYMAARCTNGRISHSRCEYRCNRLVFQLISYFKPFYCQPTNMDMNSLRSDSQLVAEWTELVST